MTRSNSASAPVLTIGYCTDEISERALIEYGVPAWLIRKIVNHPLLTWAIIKDLLGDIASISTLRRRYIDQ